VLVVLLCVFLRNVPGKLAIYFSRCARYVVCVVATVVCCGLVVVVLSLRLIFFLMVFRATHVTYRSCAISFSGLSLLIEVARFPFQSNKRIGLYSWGSRGLSSTPPH